MDVGVDLQRVEADVLHDVDLAAGGPALAGIDAEHPDRGPHALAGRELGADLDPAVEPGGLAPRPQARRGDGVALEIVLPRLDDEHAVFDPGVLRPGLGVVLQFFVPDEPLLLVPLVRVRQARDAELIRPDKLPLLGRRIRPGQHHEHRSTIRQSNHRDPFPNTVVHLTARNNRISSPTILHRTDSVQTTITSCAVRRVYAEFGRQDCRAGCIGVDIPINRKDRDPAIRNSAAPLRIVSNSGFRSFVLFRNAGRISDFEFPRCYRAR